MSGFEAYLTPLRSLVEFEKLQDILPAPGVHMVSGCTPAQKANLAFGLVKDRFRAVIITENDLKAKAFYEN